MLQEQKKACNSCNGGCHEETSEATSSTNQIQLREAGVEIELGQTSTSAPSQKLIFKIEGMCCATEVADLKSVLEPLINKRGANLTFDLINAKLTIESSGNNLPNKDEVMKAVARTGMQATLWSEHLIHADDKNFWQKYGPIMMNLASAASLVVGLILHILRDGTSTAFGGGVGEEETERGDYPPIATMALYSTSIVAGSWFILPKAARAVRRVKPDINLLMTSATVGAVAINHWFEAASSMYLFSAAGLLETWNVTRARKAIRTLMELAPSTAQVVLENGMIIEQPVEQISIDTTITVRPGEKIPMDSILIAGFTSVNQAPITGESMPVQKEVGDTLFAGTINGDGAIQCKVIKAASDSTLASIIRKVEEAQSRRAKSDQFIEKFSRYYVPSMMAASAAVSIIPPLATSASWYPWVYKGLELLVISCPCSLVISTPVSIVAGLTAAARAGVLIKGGIYLEMAAHTKAFAMDKTGTLTTGEPIVQTIIPLNDYSEQALLQLASALELHSDHPLARAIQRRARAEGITAQPAEGFQVFKGKGAEGYIDGKLFWIGSHRFLREKVGDNAPAAVHEKIQELESQGHSTVAIGYGQQICGLISIADAVRVESRHAIQAMKKAGVERVVMLTGDNKGAAQAIAHLIGIDDYYAELLPEDKVKQVENLVARYKHVAMVGDGINDAPAMAVSSLGIAMGAAGSDAAIETADIALMSDDLEKLAWLINHSRHTLNIIKQNVVFSLAVKGIFVGLIFINKSTLWMAMLSDMGSTFLVVSNALRLLNNKKKQQRATVQEAPPAMNIGIELTTHIERKAPMLYDFSRVQAPASSSSLLRDIESQQTTNLEFRPTLMNTNQTAKRTCTKSCCKSSCQSSVSLLPQEQVIVPTPASEEVVSQISAQENALAETKGQPLMITDINQQNTVPPAIVMQFNHLQQRKSANHERFDNDDRAASSEPSSMDTLQPIKKACCKGGRCGK